MVNEEHQPEKNAAADPARGEAIKHFKDREAKARNSLAAFEYIKDVDGIIRSVHCKLCGVMIRELQPLEGMGRTRVVKNRTIVEQPVILKALANYAEVTLECDDGSKHATCLCKGCAKNLGSADPEVLNALHDADIIRLISLDERHGEPRYSYHHIQSRRVLRRV